MRENSQSRHVRSLVEYRGARPLPPINRVCRRRDLLRVASMAVLAARISRSLGSKTRINLAWAVHTIPIPNRKPQRPSLRNRRRKRKRKTNQKSKMSQMRMSLAAVWTQMLTVTTLTSKERKREGKKDWKRWPKRRKRSVNKRMNKKRRMVAVLRQQANLLWLLPLVRRELLKEEALAWHQRHQGHFRLLTFPQLSLRLFKQLSPSSSLLNKTDSLTFSDHPQHPSNKTRIQDFLL